MQTLHQANTTATKQKDSDVSQESAGTSQRTVMRKEVQQMNYDDSAKALSPTTNTLSPSTVQRKGDATSTDGVQQAAARGVQGGGGSLPYLDKIQASFGSHDVSNVQAYVGGNAKGACESMGAEAYATGNSVAFKGSTSLHTAAHEAAHIVQQRAGVSLKGGVGQAGDQYEQHADAVADLVVQGKSSESLLDRFSGAGSISAGVQQKEKPLPAVRPTNWAHRVGANFSNWDKDGDGYLSKSECNALLTDPTITNVENASALATLHKYLEDLEELHDDEFGDENDGLTMHDLYAFERGGFDIANLKNRLHAVDHAGQRNINKRSTKLFAKGVPNMAAVKQGSLGDCYFLAAVASAIAVDPHAIVRMITEHKRGTPPTVFSYTVNFPGYNAVNVNPPTLAETARYSSSGANGLWLAVLEKGYAEARVNDNSAVDRDEEAGSGDMLTEGVQTMGGTGSDMDILSLTSKDETRSKLDSAFPNGKPNRIVTAGIFSENDLGLPDGHAYSVIGWDGSKLTVRNPWGSNPAGTRGEKTGVFEMTLDEFDKIFSNICYQETR
jgi:hypothetical protein